MLHKGHAPSQGIPLSVALAILLGLLVVAEASAAPFPPIGGAASVQYDAFGRPSYHQYVGRQWPLRPRAVSTQQGAGPNPDTNLSPNATGTEERDPAAVPGTNLNRVAFVSAGEDEDEDGRIDATLPDDPDFDIWIMRPDGSEQVKLVDLLGDQIQPSYHPGSNLIAFAGNQTGTWEIYTVTVNTGTPVVQCLTDKQPGEKQHPTWNSDGNWIAYQCKLTPTSDWDIYKMPASGATAQTRLTTSTGNDTDPAWAPGRTALSGGGNAIAYTQWTGTQSRVAWVDALTGESTVLSAGGLGSDREPAWSWDGARIAFASSRLTPDTADTIADYNIYAMFALGEVDGPEASVVSNLSITDTTDDLDPSWSAALDRQPQRIYYESKRADASGAEWDIWSTFSSDTAPPSLLDLPWVTRGADDLTHERQFAPGDDVYFHVPVYDADSGVSRVFVTITDPDSKYWWRNYWGAGAWDSNFSGEQYLELAYNPVASVELFDDGLAENGDKTAGDGVYSGVWSIPASLASDFAIDVYAIDSSAALNGQNYDSIYGFTSEVFRPQGNVLLVNDYCEGQWFTFELGVNNDYGSVAYCESYYTFNPGYAPAATNQTPGEYYDTSKDTIRAYAVAWNEDEPYSVWRVISRGPVPRSVYQYYLPTKEYQLDPVTAADPEQGPTAPNSREVPVAERAIVWASPHAGNLWVADGSIIDAGTQTDLAWFIDRGGRLMMSGSDIAWALTLNGTITSDFLTKYLRASYVRDVYVGGEYWYWYDPATGETVNRSQRIDLNWSVVGSSSDPVTFEPWVTTRVGPWSHYGHQAQPCVYDSDDMPTDLDTPARWDAATPTHADAHPFSWRPDVITEAAGTVKLYGYGSATGPTAGLRYEDPVTGAKVVYLAFGFESIHRGYHTPSNIPAHCRNHRATLMHNFLCWARSGSFQGKVVDVAGNKPITDPNPIVLLWAGLHTPGDRSVAPDYAVRCQDDGTYVVSGVAPGFYSMECTRPGYDIDHYDGYVCHGGWEPFKVDFAVTRARPGTLAGTVTSEATGETLGRVAVTVYAVPEEEEEDEDDEAAAAQVGADEPDWATLDIVYIGGLPATTTTAVDGTYKIENLPPGDYYVRADGAAINYGDDWAQVAIVSQNTTTQDFELPAADGTLNVTVVDDNGGAVIGGAAVQVRTAAGVRVASGTTDTSGVFSFDLQPGTYTISVSAGGYGPSTDTQAAIVSAKDTDVTVRLTREAAGVALTGRVVSATSGAPVGDVVVNLLVNGVQVDSVRTTATLIDPAGDEPAYNYRFEDVPTGEVVVRPAPVGFTASPVEQTETMESGVTLSNVNFTLDSLYVFPKGLQLTSTPYDYTGTDASVVLNVAAADLKMAAWEASRQRYRLYPQAPADEFRLGQGYWLYLSGATDVTLPGLAAPEPTEVSLGAGWNIVGNPFPALIDLYAVRVRDSSGVVMTMQRALTEGLVDGGMFAYVLGGYQTTAVFTPWVGTWIKVNAPVTLIVSRLTGTLEAGKAQPAAVRQPESGWIASIEATVDGLVDSSSHFGLAEGAGDGHDAGLDMSKPPAADMGPYVHAAFVDGSASRAVDVRSASAETTTWRLSVNSSQSGSAVTLRWPDLSALPAEVRPVLTDLATGKQVYMRTVPGYTYTCAGGAREFDVTVDTGRDGALSISAVVAQATASGGCQVAYSLSADASVDVEILNIAGRVVGRAVTDQFQAAGAHTVAWSGRGLSGAKVPGGRYLLRVSARAENGAETSAVSALSLGR